MGYSKLCDEIYPPTGKYKGGNKWSSRNGEAIIGVVVHHWASTSKSGFNRLVVSNDPASANYLIWNTGTLTGSVDEDYRAWTSGSGEVDRPRITIEIQNETGGPSWKISSEAQATLVNLLVDLAKRYGWGAITRSREVRGHQEFEATACPGPYLYPRLGEIAKRAEAKRTGKPVTPPKPKPSGKNVVEDGKIGSDSILWTQKRLKEIGKYKGLLDGKIDNQNPYWEDDNSGFTTGWDWDKNYKKYSGSKTIHAMWEVFTEAGFDCGKNDGLVGPKFNSGWQRYLDKYAGYDEKIDGEFWYEGTAATCHQKLLNSAKGFKR